MEINGIKTCEPIECLVGYLKEHDFLITEQRIEDSHFNELYIKMIGYYFQELDNIKRKGIEKTVKINNAYICDCHWSIVQLELKK